MHLFHENDWKGEGGKSSLFLAESLIISSWAVCPADGRDLTSMLNQLCDLHLRWKASHIVTAPEASRAPSSAQIHNKINCH